MRSNEHWKPIHKIRLKKLNLKYYIKLYIDHRLLFTCTDWILYLGGPDFKQYIQFLYGKKRQFNCIERLNTNNNVKNKSNNFLLNISHINTHHTHRKNKNNKYGVKMNTEHGKEFLCNYLFFCLNARKNFR